MKLKKLSVFVMALALSLSTATVQFVSAESYAGVALGVSLGGDYDDISGTTAAGVKGTLTDLDSDESFMYGFKMGHYFKSIPWLGVEFNFSQSDPDIDKQSATTTGTAGIFGTTTGQAELNAENLTTFGFLAMLRATEEQSKILFNVQPYLGVGFGVNSVNLSEGIATTTAGAAVGKANLESDTSIGFLLTAGLNYNITDRIKAYGEYKYTEGNFDMTTETVKYEFDLDDHALMFGLAYGF